MKVLKKPLPRSAAAACATLLGMFSMLAQSESTVTADRNGNINQRSIGVFKSNTWSDEFAQGGQVVSETKALPVFSRLKLGVPAELFYRENGRSSIDIEGAVGTLATLRIEVRAGTLFIDSDRARPGPLQLVVSGTGLRGASISSSADAVFDGLQGLSFELAVSGTADISLNGKVRECSLAAQGSADIDQAELLCGTLQLSVIGAGDIAVYAAKSLQGRVQGAGDLKVHGQPQQRAVQASGAFDIEYL
ncbi:GIN domain-containing protein [Allohahella marinimesophila]|uniref:Putative auto-transporter adhesin head GIN domain-containing protein n=1 Tax=Allohahella marinimesophila TaxID=1054972 RepID=A0ABP7PIC7_9GAMM